MNILLFVTSMLMILSFLTYARLDTFRYTLGIQAEFERYMKSLERVYINKTAKQWYNSTVARGAAATTPSNPVKETAKPTVPHKTNPKEQKPLTLEESAKPSIQSAASTGPPTSRLSIRILIDPKMRAENEQAYVQTVEWLKRLMQNLYGEQPFFKRTLEKNPNFMDDLIKELADAVQALSEKKRPKDAEDLSNISLNSDLEEIFYLMLKGCAREDLLNAEKPQETFRPNVTLPSEEGNQEDETDALNEAQEYSSTPGYNSLLNYISLRNTTKIRIYLASRDLLTVIFGELSVADEIIRMRYNLYRAVINNNGMPPEEAAQQFQGAFQGAALGNVGTMLDFRVTKTNPSDYN